MESEDERRPHIREAYLALDALWFVFSVLVLFLSEDYNISISRGTYVYDFTWPLSLILSGISAISLLVVTYSVFIMKRTMELSLKERFVDSNHRYLMLLLLLFVPDTLFFFIRPDSYSLMVIFTISLLFLTFLTPIAVFFVSFKSSDFGIKNTMKRYVLTSVFFSFTVISIILSVALLFLYLNPQIAFYMADDPSETYYSGDLYNATVHIGVVNKGLLPANNITIVDNGVVIYRITTLGGGTYQYVNVKINCTINETEGNRTNGDYENHPSRCPANISLVYEGRVVDRISELPEYQNTCTDIFLIIGAPTILLTKNMRKRKK